jgi:transposase
MSQSLFWLSDKQWEKIAGLMPDKQSGARRVDDRRVISGILHMLRSGGRWIDCPSVYGPYTTIYNRFNRWSRRGVWHKIYQALTDDPRTPRQLMVDSSYVKAHRSAAGAKRGIQIKTQIRTLVVPAAVERLKSMQ